MDALASQTECPRSGIIPLQSSLGEQLDIDFKHVFDAVDSLLGEANDCEDDIEHEMDQIIPAAEKLIPIIVHFLPESRQLDYIMTWQLFRGPQGIWDILQGRCSAEYLSNFKWSPTVYFINKLNPPTESASDSSYSSSDD